MSTDGVNLNHTIYAKDPLLTAWIRKFMNLPQILAKLADSLHSIRKLPIWKGGFVIYEKLLEFDLFVVDDVRSDDIKWVINRENQTTKHVFGVKGLNRWTSQPFLTYYNLFFYFSIIQK